jgi:hypothetical protein
MQKCEEINILGRPPVSPPFPAPSRNWRSRLPQRLEEQRHARQPVVFVRRWFSDICNVVIVQKPLACLVLPLVALRLIHSILIVAEKRWRCRFLHWFNGTMVLLTLFLLFVHFGLSMYHYKLIVHKLRFLRTGTKVTVVIHFEICPMLQLLTECVSLLLFAMAL